MESSFEKKVQNYRKNGTQSLGRGPHKKRALKFKLHWFHNKSASDLDSVKLVSTAPHSCHGCSHCYALLTWLSYLKSLPLSSSIPGPHFFKVWFHNAFFDSTQQKDLLSPKVHNTMHRAQDILSHYGLQTIMNCSI